MQFAGLTTTTADLPPMIIQSDANTLGIVMSKLSQPFQFVSPVGASLCQDDMHSGGAHRTFFAVVSDMAKGYWSAWTKFNSK